MVEVAMGRESMTHGMQVVLSPLHNDNEVEEIKRNYSIQNNLLARRNEELQLKVTNLEKHLFHTQKQILTLKNEKIQLNEKLKLNSKRFNDLIIDGFDKMISEYRNFMIDVGVDVEKKAIPVRLLEKVSECENNEDTNAFEFDHYWKNINNDLQRRKSFIFAPNGKIPSENERIDCDNDSDQLETLVENEEIGVIKLDPEYQDKKSSYIPQKRQSMRMEKIEFTPMELIPFLCVDKNDNSIQEHTSDEFFNGEMDMEIESPSQPRNQTPCPSLMKAPAKSDSPMKQSVESKSSNKEIGRDLLDNKSKVTKRKNKVPRELKNLDTEKTKRWLGMDPLDDVEESTSERRKSRRRSLVINYQLPIHRNQQNKRLSGRFTPPVSYLDVDKENRVKKPTKGKLGVLKDITNIKNHNNNNNTNMSNRKINGSIFDLENQNIF